MRRRKAEINFDTQVRPDISIVDPSSEFLVYRFMAGEVRFLAIPS